ncbi:peptidoglycan recognition protein family protein [Dysosmobacter sp. Phy]
MEETVYEMPRRRRSHRHRRRPARRKRRPLTLVLLAAAALAGAVLWLNRDTGLPGEHVALPSYVEQDLLPINEWSRPGTELEEIRGVVIHYVGNPGTAARANRNYFASLADGTEGTYASSHFIVGLEGEVIQCVPLTEIAYASNERNDDTIAIEVCHPDAAGQFSDVTYWRTVELTAWLCHTFHLDPERDVIRHYDVTGKRCPVYYVEHPEAWEDFLVDVAAAAESLAAEDAA